jgi:hypothetical protein
MLPSQEDSYQQLFKDSCVEKIHKYPIEISVIKTLVGISL